MSLRVVIVTRISAGARRLRRRRPRRGTRAGRAPVDARPRRPLRQPPRHWRARDAAPRPSSTSSCRRAASSIAPLLASVEPDLVVCMGFPWKIPPDALAVPRLGWLNGHPSLLPRHRGPLPVAWAIREGDEEIGITFHRMDADLDTGPILAQRRYPARRAAAAGHVLSGARPGRRRGARRGARAAGGGRRGDAAGGGRQLRDVLHRGRRLARPLPPGGRGAPARLGLALRDVGSAGRAARCSSSTASRCACSPPR